MTVLTLTPSGFLFSRLLAAVETKTTMGGNQTPAEQLHRHMQQVHSRRPMTSSLRVALPSEAEEEKAKSGDKKSPKKAVTETGACG